MCDCNDNYNEVVLSIRYLPWSVWSDACKLVDVYSHDIIQREVEFGKAVAKKLLPSILHEYLTWELYNWPIDNDQPANTIAIKVMLKLK